MIAIAIDLHSENISFENILFKVCFLHTLLNRMYCYFFVTAGIFICLSIWLAFDSCWQHFQVRTVVWAPDRFFQRTKAKKPCLKKKIPNVFEDSGFCVRSSVVASPVRCEFSICSFALGFLLAFLCWLSFAHLIVLCVSFSNCIYVLAACLSRFCFWRLLNWSCPHTLIICLTNSVQQQAWLLLKSSVIFLNKWSSEGVLERTYAVLLRCIYLFITL